MDDRSTRPAGPESQTHVGRGRSPFWFVWAFVLLFVVYPLSLGPAARFNLKHPAASSTLETVYKPLIILITNYKPLGDLTLWYIHKVWKIPGPTPPPPTVQTNSAPASAK